MQVVEKSKSLLHNLSQESAKTTASSAATESDNESVTSETSATSSRASRKRKAVKFKEVEAILPAIMEESVNEGEEIF